MRRSNKSNQLLARLNFPPYTVHCLTERHFLVAGGGGGAKTGIRNVIEIYELINNGDGCRAKSVTHYETGTQAIMNCSVFDAVKYSILFAGMEGICQLYKLRLCVKECDYLPNGFVKKSVHAPYLRSCKNENLHDDQRKNGTVQSVAGEAKSSMHTDLHFDVKQLDSFQTDFSDDPFQKLSKFSIMSKTLATAGADGHIRVWKYPEMRLLYKVQAHNDDVDDLDFSPLGDKIISVSRDGQGKVWSAKDGTLICNLQHELPHHSQTKYIYRSCRFAVVENDKLKPALFITMNPAVRKRPLPPCFLSKWDGTTFVIGKIVSTGNEMQSVMAVSDDGRFIALGTQEGSVSIYIAFSLQVLYRADHVHSIFVTGLEFLKSSDTTQRITGGHETSLISISVDNHINIHYIPNRTSFGLFSIAIMFTVLLFSIFLLMDYFNL